MLGGGVPGGGSMRARCAAIRGPPRTKAKKGRPIMKLIAVITSTTASSTPRKAK